MVLTLLVGGLLFLIPGFLIYTLVQGKLSGPSRLKSEIELWKCKKDLLE